MVQESEETCLYNQPPATTQPFCKKVKKMGSEAKTGGATTTNKSATAAAAAAGGGGGGGGGGGFRAKLEYYLYSGEKKHVIAGIAIIGALFGVPWYLMNRGSKHRSHQDYMEKADRARKERLSGGPSSAKYPTGG